MENKSDTLPDDVEALKSLILEQQRRLAEQEARIAQQSTYINQLLEQINLARHQRFGASSEKITLDQLGLSFDEAEVTTLAAEALAEREQTDGDDGVVPVTGHRRRRGGRRPLPAELPRVEVVYELEGEACRCGQCQGGLEVIGEKVSEQLDIVPARVQVLRHVRRTYRCPDCEGRIVSAPRPAQPIPRSNASPGTLAQVAVAKYADGLPLYRQEQQLKRIGVELPRATLASWMVKAGTLVQPLINLLRERMLAYPVLAMDETRIQVLKEAGRAPESLSWLWVQRGGPPDHPIVLYDYDPSRGQQVPKRLLGDHAGFLQTDGYEAYSAACTANGIVQVGCWAHARRRFDEALKAQGKTAKGKPSLAAQAINRIGRLYQIESKAQRLSDAERRALRQQRAVPVLEALREWLVEQLPRVPAKSALGKAMGYLHSQWDKLTVYATDGRLRIDNNLVENAIRPFVIGRKNYLFCDSVAGAAASANLYSLIETAKANGLSPYDYLRLIFTELPAAETVGQVEALLPLPPST
jgi:transposase